MGIEIVKFLMWPVFIFVAYVAIRFALKLFDKKRANN